MFGKLKFLALFILFPLLSGCASYYQKQLKFQTYIQAGNYADADKLLNTNNKESKGVNRVLYYMNKGVTSFMLGEYEQSNTWFLQADHYVEDFNKSLGYEALGLISNPMIKPYTPEDFEGVMIYYYKALNYIYLNNLDEALVECRRLNLQLNRINDKYKKDKNKYTQDAFAHNLMGIIYEAQRDYNNAFIAYRNAFDAYESTYVPLFKQTVPEQLKLDLIRTANLTGFYSEQKFYEEKFGINYQPKPDSSGDLVFFWMNGLGPVKAEWSINFTNTGNNDGWITLADDESGMSFPVFIGNRSGNEQSAFKNLSFLRVAFPKYKTREPLFSSATLQLNDSISKKLELAEPINAIAYQSLKDRMIREMANGIARLATKKALEQLARQKDDNLGTIISIINAVSEKADTRNWQSLPYSISYARMTLPPGDYKIMLNTYGNVTSSTPFEFTIEANKTLFHTFHTMESQP